MPCFVLPAIFLLCRVTLSLAARSDVTVESDVIIATDPPPAVSPEVALLRAEVKKLRRTFNRFKKGGVRGQTKLCETASQQMSDHISMELSGLRSQLHTSDSVKSLRSELQYGLTSLRSELDNKVTSVRAEVGTGLAAIRSELQGSMSEIRNEVNAELTDIRAEVQYSLNTACSEEKEVNAALADVQAGLATVKSDLENRVATTRAELEQKVLGVRAALEGDMMGVQADFKTDVVSVRSDLQDMVAGVRTEFQDSVAGTRSELQTGFMAAQSGLQNSLQSLHADLMDVRSKAETDVATIRVELSGVTSVVKADVQSQLTETRSALLSAQQSLETDLGSQLQDVAAKVQHIATDQSQLAYNASTLRQGLNEVKVSAERSLATLKDDLADDLQGLGSRLDDAISALTSELQRQSAQTLADVTNNVTFVDTKLSMLERDLDLQVNSLHADLDSKVGDLEKELKRSQKKMTSERAARKEQVALLTDKVTATHDALQREVAQLTNHTQHARGSVFVRWGRSNCSHTSHLVYTGVVGGSSYDTDGGAANRLCLTLEPQAGNVTGARTYIYGAEYKFSGHHDLDVVCSVCHTPLPTTLMVPGTHTCPPGWSEQYSGHLTAGMVGHRAASEYLCLDSNPEHRPGSQEIRNGALFYYVFTECGSLPCPPYANMYVTCVVCSR